MATREQRLNEFSQGAPPSAQSIEILCEDHNGTYALPYPCHWFDGSWRNMNTGATIDASVIGWRLWD